MVYGLLAIIAAIIMLIPKTGTEGNQSDHIRFPKILTSIMTFVVGLASGIVGAGGAFLLVPLMHNRHLSNDELCSCCSNR